MSAIFAAALAVTAVASGLLSSLLGIGGATVIIPALRFLFGVPVHAAAAIAAVQVAAATAAGSHAYLQRGAVDRRVAFPLAVGGMAGGMIGGVVSRWLPAVVIAGLFAASVVAAVGFSFRRPAASAREGHRFLHDAAMGMVVGVLAGIIGIGGGVYMNPYLLGVVGLPPHNALPTSLVFITLTAVASAAGKLSTGQVPYLPALVAAAGAAAGARIGASVQHRIPAGRLLALMRIVLSFLALTAVIDCARLLR